jgi:hypothetical protein
MDALPIDPASARARAVAKPQVLPPSLPIKDHRRRPSSAAVIPCQARAALAVAPPDQPARSPTCTGTVKAHQAQQQDPRAPRRAPVCKR